MHGRMDERPDLHAPALACVQVCVQGACGGRRRRACARGRTELEEPQALARLAEVARGELDNVGRQVQAMHARREQEGTSQHPA